MLHSNASLAAPAASHKQNRRQSLRQKVLGRWTMVYRRLAAHPWRDDLCVVRPPNRNRNRNRNRRQSLRQRAFDTDTEELSNLQLSHFISRLSSLKSYSQIPPHIPKPPQRIAHLTPPQLPHRSTRHWRNRHKHHNENE